MLRKEARRKQPEYKYVEKESTNKLKQPKNTQMSITLHQIYAVDSNRRYTNGYYRSHFGQRQNAIWVGMAMGWVYSHTRLSLTYIY